MLGSWSVRFLAFWRIFDETSMPMRILADLATCWKRSPVPQPTSKTCSFWLGLVLFTAASILEFCSSEY